MFVQWRLFYCIKAKSKVYTCLARRKCKQEWTQKTRPLFTSRILIAVSVWRLEPVLWSSSESVSLSVCLQWALFSHRGNAQSMCYNWCLGRSACVVVGPWADHGREQGSNIQRAEVLKTMKRVTAVTDCAFDALFFDVWSFCCCCFFPQFSCSQWTLLLLPAAFWPTCQAINISSRTLRPLPVTHSQDLGGLRSSTSGVGEPHVCLVVVVVFFFFSGLPKRVQTQIRF